MDPVAPPTEPSLEIKLAPMLVKLPALWEPPNYVKLSSVQSERLMALFFQSCLLDVIHGDAVSPFTTVSGAVRQIQEELRKLLALPRGSQEELIQAYYALRNELITMESVELSRQKAEEEGQDGEG